jgi:hypothetical protein
MAEVLLLCTFRYNQALFGNSAHETGKKRIFKRPNKNRYGELKE